VLSRRRFAPGWKLTAFAAVFLPVLIALGTWQLQRGGEKAALEARIAERAARPATTRTPDELGGVDRHAPVIVRGRWRDDRAVLLDNRTHEGRAGYELLVPLVPLTGDGSGVLVDLGWLPAPPRRETLPEIDLPATPVSVRGTVVDPDAGAPVFGTVAETERWPLRVQRVEPAPIGEAAGLALVEAVLVAAPGTPGAGEYVHAPVRMSAATHYGYAAQWYGLALVLALGWLVASLPRREDDGSARADAGDDDGERR
jgi:cytochrome oxidase assembly protein ShyY1